LLLNVVKHAGAKNVKVSARREAPNIRVQVEDDGLGALLEKEADLEVVAEAQDGRSAVQLTSLET